MRIVLFGPPGAGKGTQAKLLAKRLQLAHISTGELLRAVIKAETEVGKVAQSYIKQGKLVPSKIVRVLAENTIADNQHDQFILDGYPRTMEQAEWLTAFLNKNQANPFVVVSLVVPDEFIVKRLSQRRINNDTGETYHLTFNPPPAEVDPTLIIQREDDKPEAILSRLREYHGRTEPVKEYYMSHGNFREVDGVGGVEEVYGRILEVLHSAVPA